MKLETGGIGCNHVLPIIILAGWLKHSKALCDLTTCLAMLFIGTHHFCQTALLDFDFLPPRLWHSSRTYNNTEHQR